MEKVVYLQTEKVVKAMNTILQQTNAQIHSLCRKHRVKSLYVFGSVLTHGTTSFMVMTACLQTSFRASLSITYLFYDRKSLPSWMRTNMSYNFNKTKLPMVR